MPPRVLETGPIIDDVSDEPVTAGPVVKTFLSYESPRYCQGSSAGSYFTEDVGKWTKSGAFVRAQIDMTKGTDLVGRALLALYGVGSVHMCCLDEDLSGQGGLNGRLRCRPTDPLDLVVSEHAEGSPRMCSGGALGSHVFRAKVGEYVKAAGTTYAAIRAGAPEETQAAARAALDNLESDCCLTEDQSAERILKGQIRCSNLLSNMASSVRLPGRD